MSKPLDFGVQSYCFRNFKSNADVAAKVREIGLDKIEVCAVHADFNNPEAWKDIVKTYQDAGVAVVSIGVQTFSGADSEKQWFECAALAGAKHVSAHFKVDTYPRALAKVRKWSREYGIKVGIHCHGGYMFGGQPDVMQHLVDLGGPEVGVCLDTAWCLQIGPRQGNPIDWVERFSGRVHGVHYKDFVFDESGTWIDTVVGEGNLDLPAFVKALEADNFDGMAVLEYEADPDDPVPALKACVEKMRQLA